MVGRSVAGSKIKAVYNRFVDKSLSDAESSLNPVSFRCLRRKSRGKCTACSMGIFRLNIGIGFFCERLSVEEEIGYFAILR